jgi:tRNA1(Val) A37 N6-methylase TrmN6
LAKSVDFKGIYAIDISNSAVEIAKENVFRNCLENKIVVLNTDFKKFDFSIFK